MQQKNPSCSAYPWKRNGKYTAAGQWWAYIINKVYVPVVNINTTEHLEKYVLSVIDLLDFAASELAVLLLPPQHWPTTVPPPKDLSHLHYKVR